MAKIYKLDEYRAECDIEPFVLDTGEQQIIIAAPTGETLLEIAETPLLQGRRLLQLLCGEQFDAVWDIVKVQQGTVLVKLLQDMGRHFQVTTIAEAPGGRAASLS